MMTYQAGEGWGSVSPLTSLRLHSKPFISRSQGVVAFSPTVLGMQAPQPRFGQQGQGTLSAQGFSVHAQRFLQAGIDAWVFPQTSASSVSQQPQLSTFGQQTPIVSASATAGVPRSQPLQWLGHTIQQGVQHVWQTLQRVPQQLGQWLGTISEQAQHALRWAQGEVAKGINEKQHQGYISQTYSRGKNQPWCADFVSTAYQQAGGSPFGHQPAVRDIWQWGQQTRRAFEKGTQPPQPGDLIVFNVGGSPNHIGLVERVTQDTVYTIEGNSSDALKRRSYPLNAKNIRGYVRPA
ncbi:MAG: CHAP domain-containing protein [Vampirovibrionales bacterium]